MTVKHDLVRRSIRLRGYDYTTPGAYFVTICTYQRQCLLGKIVENRMQPNHNGDIALDCWSALPRHFSHVSVDAFVVMPNHVHGIIIIDDTPDPDVGAQHAAPLPAKTDPPRPHVQPGSLGAIVRSYKSAVTRATNLQRQTPGSPVWQRNYYEHIIRDEISLCAIREYIRTNPEKWATDANNPDVSQ